MTERFLAIGNEAIGWGALLAGCEAFFGYPITPQNEVAEWFAREFPARGRLFFQAPSEVAAINLLFGAAACGARAMTSTSSPGWALMQETMSHPANAELPCVVVLVQRGGQGRGRHGTVRWTTSQPPEAVDREGIKTSSWSRHRCRRTATSCSLPSISPINTATPS